MATDVVIDCEAVGKSFAGRLIIDDFSTVVSRGSVTVILAPSGAGKTTLLRLIAGLDEPSSGTIRIDGSSPDPARTGCVFQDDSAFAWLTVRKNIAFSLLLKRASLKERSGSAEVVTRMGAEMGLTSVMDAFPSAISAGQRQRCVIARAIIANPHVLLCDEPFSSLDDPVRQSLRELLLAIRERYQTTIVFVTHSVEEACFLADDILICSGPPLRIVRARPVAFGPERTSATRRDKEFVKLVTTVEDEIESFWRGV